MEGEREMDQGPRIYPAMHRKMETSAFRNCFSSDRDCFVCRAVCSTRGACWSIASAIGNAGGRQGKGGCP